MDCWKKIFDFEFNCDLVAAKNGGRVLFATDDGFAVAENMLKDTPAERCPGQFTDFGAWMDGWETRRKRIAGHDWCIIKLGIPGSIQGVDVDTSFFIGNYPPSCSIQAGLLTPEEEAQLPSRQSVMGSGASVEEIAKAESIRSDLWEELLPMTPLKPGTPETCHNRFQLTSSGDKRFTHIRLNLFPDGGVARLRVYGTPQFDWDHHPAAQVVDLVALSNGGRCVAFSDAHFGQPLNLISPGRGINMGDGWETARRLDRPAILEVDSEGHLKVTGKEWACFRLGHAGMISTVEIDTNHFKGNAPDFCYLEGCQAPPEEEAGDEILARKEGEPWQVILPSQKLSPHKLHTFPKESIRPHGPVNLIRLVIAPDGGVSRLRLWGTVA